MSFNETDRARVLAEALPYIQKYSGKTIVVKYGGSALSAPELRRGVTADVLLLSLVGIHMVVVHGNDFQVDGGLNNRLVATLNGLGGRALGLCGVDGGLFRAKRIEGESGAAGQLTRVDPRPVTDILDGGYIPVVSTVAQEAGGEGVLELDADRAASKLAVALGAEKLLLLTDSRGVLEDVDDESTLISELQLSSVPALVRKGTVSGGMASKVDCCVEAVRSGVKSATILDGRTGHAIINELLSDAGTGTMLVN